MIKDWSYSSILHMLMSHTLCPAHGPCSWFPNLYNLRVCDETVGEHGAATFYRGGLCNTQYVQYDHKNKLQTAANIILVWFALLTD